jgi:Mrp family chromosome partitioning ATPase
MRLPSRAQWFGARATNVLRNPVRLGLVASGVFVVILAAYLLVPLGLRGARGITDPPQVARIDTSVIVERTRAAEREVAAADSILIARRRLNAVARAEATIAAITGESWRRDSITRAMAELTGLIVRAETAPLPVSYAALGGSTELRDLPGVRALLDSLEELVRARDMLGRGATVDPRYVAQTTRMGELGRALLRTGAMRLDVLRKELERASVEGGSRVPTTLPDTVAARARRDRTRDALTRAQVALLAARAANFATDSSIAAARARTRVAPVPVLATAALVLGCFLAFGIALIDEMRQPRVADFVEVERRTNLRVLATVGLRSIPGDRSRRAADRALAPLLDPTGDEYRMVAWHLASQWPRDGVVTVAADEPMIAATIGANIAAVLANDARATVLIDTVFDLEPVRRVLGLPASPGLAAVLDNRLRWSESLRPIDVGRSRTLEVLPSGHRSRLLGPSETQALMTEVGRASRRHDAAVVIATTSSALRGRAGDDVVLCAQLGRTRLASLDEAVYGLIHAGARVRGIVLWQGADPGQRTEDLTAG